MKTIRYFLFMLFLAPGLAFAQETTTDVTLVVAGNEYEALGAAWDNTVPWIAGEPIGPLPLVIVEGNGTTPDTTPEMGCDPYTPENAALVEGNIAFVQRGVCSFVIKNQNASAAGAVAVIVYNDDRVPPDDETLVSMGGDPCGPAEGCSAPAVFISRASGLAVLTDIEFGEQGTLIPEEPPPPPVSVVIDNGTLVNSLFGNGFIGSDPTFAFGEGFTFEGTNGLFVSSLLIGVDGDVTSNPYDGESEFIAVQDPVLLDPASVPAPFDAGAQAVFTSPLGFNVTLTGYADADAPNEDFVIYEVAVTNTTTDAINGVYLGIFADWDVGTTSSDDDGGVDEDLNLVYVFDPVEAAPYFGVTAIGEPGSLSGYNTTATDADDAQLFGSMTAAVDTAGVQEQAAVLGIGPIDIAAGETVTRRFAFVGGADLADLQANAEAAQNPGTSVEQTTPEGTFVLESAYPNPFVERTTIGFELPTAQDVRLSVYDVLGREVAVLVDGMRQAGAQTVVFDAASLPSGVYVYRLEAGATQLTQQITLVR